MKGFQFIIILVLVASLSGCSSWLSGLNGQLSRLTSEVDKSANHSSCRYVLRDLSKPHPSTPWCVPNGVKR